MFTHSSVVVEPPAGLAAQAAGLDVASKQRARPVLGIPQIAHQDLWQSAAGEALFFHARYVRPGWARSKVALATIDSHIFYR